MKPHLPACLFQALIATCAVVLSSTTVSADVPSGYTPVIITDVEQLAYYTESDCMAFIIRSDITDSAYRLAGAHQYWTDDVLHMHLLTFAGIESDTAGGALYSKELVAARLQELRFSQNVSTSLDGGGAIYGSNITLSDNGVITFIGNSSSVATYSHFAYSSSYSYSYGGAICGGRYSTIAMTNNDAVTFSGNYASAIDTLPKSSYDWEFYAYSHGGAIYGGDYSALTLSGNGKVTFNGNYAITAYSYYPSYYSSYPSSYGGAIYGGNYSAITLRDNECVTFSGNYVANTIASPSESGFAPSSYGGAIYGGSDSDITLSNNGSVTFSGNYVTTRSSSYANSYSHGGAIYADDTITISSNGSVTFSENHADTTCYYYDYSYGGAIDATNVYMADNESVNFGKNRATYGGAINSNNWLHIYNNTHVTFSGNVATDGGAIYGSTTLKDNGTVTFSGNYASSFRAQPNSDSISSYGGAISGLSQLNGNESVTFSGNYASSSSTNYSYSSCSSNSYGGAFYANFITLSDNGVIAFNENYASSVSSVSAGSYTHGGALYAQNTLTVSGNESVTFSGNYASSSSTNYSYSSSYGGAICGSSTLSGNGSVTFSENYANSVSRGDSFSYGGAIYGSSSISLVGNEVVTFSRNYASSSSSSYGGAIYGSSSISLIGNELVTFSRNYERRDIKGSVTYRLRSMYMDGGKLNLAAGEGQTITFYDTLYAGTGTKVSFNASYQDKEGVTQDATGDIVFSGAHAEADLKELKSNYTSQELTNSLMTEVYATTNLYGGRLRIEDGAIYRGNGINVAEGSDATLRLVNSTLEHPGYRVKLGSSTILQAQGANMLTASVLEMHDGSTLAFTLGVANLTKAAITLDGVFSQDGHLSITLVNDGTMVSNQKYALLQLESGTTPTSWNSAKVTLSGGDTNVNHLSWSNGVLYYTSQNVLPGTIPTIWAGGQGMAWNVSDKNWQKNGLSCAYEDGVSVLFKDTGSGTVTLAGTLAPMSVSVQNSSGHNYTWSGSGKLTGSMALNKSGEGSLTITTANTYTGGTTISGGVLIAENDSALGTGPIMLSGGTLIMSGELKSELTIKGGALNTGNGLMLSKDRGIQFHGGSITGDLTIGAEGYLAARTYAGPVGPINGMLTLAGGSLITSRNPLIVNGELALNGQTMVVVEDLDYGNRTLVTADSISGSVDNLILVVPECYTIYYSNKNYEIKKEGNELIFSATRERKDISIPKNGTWAHGESGFANGDQVTFVDCGTVTVRGIVNPRSVTVEGNGDTTWSGSGTMAGIGTLTKKGSGTLTINTSNSFMGNTMGGTFIMQGTVSAGADNALGTGAVTMQGGTTLKLNGRNLGQNDVTVAGNATLAAGSGGQVKSLTLSTDGGALGQQGVLLFAEKLALSGTLKTGALTLEKGNIEGGSITVTGAATVKQGYIGSNISGKTLEKTGDKRVELKGTNSFSGGVTVSGGQLALQEGGSFSGNISVKAGAALLAGVTVNGDITLASGADMHLRPDTTYKLQHKLTSSGGTLHGDFTTAGGAAITLNTSSTSTAGLTVSGTLTLTSSLTQGSLSAGGSWSTGSTYTLIQADHLNDQSGKTLYTLFNLSESGYTITNTGSAVTLKKKAVSAALQRMAATAPPAMAADDGGGIIITGAPEPLLTETAVDGVADAMVQAVWGVVDAGRAFGDAMRGAHGNLRALGNGNSAVWMNAFGNMTRQSTAHGHAGADRDLTGAALGFETMAGEHGVAGIGIGHSWSRVNTFGMSRLKQDAQHAGVYGRARVHATDKNSLWIEGSAAYGKTESRGQLGYSRERWTQNSGSLALRVNDVLQLDSGTSLNFFGGMEYLATNNGNIEDVKTGSVQNMRGEIGAGIMHTVGNGVVFAEAALQGDMVRHNPQADVGIRRHGANPGRIGGSISVGGAYSLGEHWSVNAAYTFGGVKHNNCHSANVGATFRF